MTHPEVKPEAAAAAEVGPQSVECEVPFQTMPDVDESLVAKIKEFMTGKDPHEWPSYLVSHELFPHQIMGMGFELAFRKVMSTIPVKKPAAKK